MLTMMMITMAFQAYLPIIFFFISCSHILDDEDNDDDNDGIPGKKHAYVIIITYNHILDEDDADDDNDGVAGK